MTKCLNDHVALKVCVDKMCTVPAPICQQKQCQYSTKHSKCMMISPVNNIINMLSDKALQYSALDDVVVSFYDKIVKAVEKQKRQYTKLMKQSGLRLKGDEGKLFKLLQQGPTQEIKPNMIFEVLQSLLGKYMEEVQVFKRQLKVYGKSIRNQIQSQLQQLRSIWSQIISSPVQLLKKPSQSITPIDFKFDPRLCNKKIEIIKQKEVRKLSMGYSLALITPPISQLKDNSKVKLTVTNKGCVRIGVASIQQAIKCNFQWPQNDQGLYVISHDGGVRNIQNMVEHKKQVQFKFSSGDILQMQYDSSDCSLKLSNITQSLNYVIKNIRLSQTNPLYYCVNLLWDSDTIQIL